MTHRHRITRRHFVCGVATGAASICLCGCRIASKRDGSAIEPTTETGQLPPRLADRQTFRRLADAALDATSADHIFVRLHDRIGGLTQFDDDRITDHVEGPAARLSVTVAFDQQVGSAASADLTADAIAAAVQRAEQHARAALPSPDYLPPLPPQRYPVLPTYRHETATADRARRAADAPEIVSLYRTEDLHVSGIVATSAEAVGLAADTGLFAFEQRTLAEVDITSIGSPVAIRVANANRSIDDLCAVEHARRVVSRAKWLAAPRALTPGRYPVILPPTAVAQLLRPLLDATAARSHVGTLRDKLGSQIIDSRFTLQNRPDHPELVGNGFADNGLPADARPWIERGVLTQLYHDRLSARDNGTSPTFAPDAWHLAGADPTGESVHDLIRAIGRGVLVASFDEIRCVDHAELTVTGHTGDGAFLVEDGEIVAGLMPLRWRECPLRVFGQVEAFTAPLDTVVAPNAVPDEAVTSGIRKLLVPAMTIRDFTFEGQSSRGIR